MKTKLPYFLLLFSLISFGQTPISNFYSVPNSNFAIVTSTPAIDQSATGANLTWNFTNLTQVGTNTDSYTTPTALELSAFPGTTSVLTITETSTSDESKIYSQDVAGQVSITGAVATDLELNYISNNALIGTFPLNYNYNNSDPVAGNYTYTTYSGTFSGSITSTVDAYGTLNMNDLGEGAFSGSVTRLKTVQNLSLNYIIPNAGTGVQTTYYYYDSSNGNLVFRTNTVSVVVPLLGLNQTTTVMESFLPISTLSTNQNNMVSTELYIVPNPVGDVLNIRLSQNEIIRSITITDISGRQILNLTDNLTTVSVSNLEVGMYMANITTDKGVYTKKFLKK
jgi:hypothetical protein